MTSSCQRVAPESRLTCPTVINPGVVARSDKPGLAVSERTSRSWYTDNTQRSKQTQRSSSKQHSRYSHTVSCISYLYVPWCFSLFHDSCNPNHTSCLVWSLDWQTLHWPLLPGSQSTPLRASTAFVESLQLVNLACAIYHSRISFIINSVNFSFNFHLACFVYYGAPKGTWWQNLKLLTCAREVIAEHVIVITCADKSITFARDTFHVISPLRPHTCTNGPFLFVYM